MTASAALISDFEKIFGKSNVKEPRWLSTGFAPLDEAISGEWTGAGLRQGCLYEVAGESGTGKTGFITDLVTQAQRAGGVGGLIDWERTFNEQLAVEGYGMSTETPYWFYQRPRTWEEGNMLAAKYAKWIRENKVIPEDAPIVIGLDSIASAIPMSMAEKEFDQYTMNDTTALARVTSTTLKSMGMFADDYNATFVYLNQIRLKPGVAYGDPRTTPGGKAMEFYATARIFLGKEKVMKQVDGSKEFVGQNVGFQVVKTKLTKPFKSTTMRLSFNDDGCAFFDKNFSLVDTAAEAGKIKVPSKGFVEWDGKRMTKGQLAELVERDGLQSQVVALLSS